MKTSDELKQIIQETNDFKKDEDHLYAEANKEYTSLIREGLIEPAHYDIPLISTFGPPLYR